MRIVTIHNGAVGEDGSVLFYESMLCVNMAEEEGFEIERREFGEKFFGAIIDVVVEIQYAVCRRMSYENVGVRRNILIEFRLTV